MRSQIQNKRDSIRHTIDANATMNLADIGKLDAQMIDISSGGASISMNQDVPVGQEMDMSLNYNGLEIKAKVKVVNKIFDKKTGNYKLGLKFIDIDEETAKMIPYACMSANSL